MVGGGSFRFRAIKPLQNEPTCTAGLEVSKLFCKMMGLMPPKTRALSTQARSSGSPEATNIIIITIAVSLAVQHTSSGAINAHALHTLGHGLERTREGSCNYTSHPNVTYLDPNNVILCVNGEGEDKCRARCDADPECAGTGAYYPLSSG
jgi:hypothetical protein